MESASMDGPWPDTKKARRGRGRGKVSRKRVAYGSRLAKRTRPNRTRGVHAVAIRRPQRVYNARRHTTRYFEHWRQKRFRGRLKRPREVMYMFLDNGYSTLAARQTHWIPFQPLESMAGVPQDPVPVPLTLASVWAWNSVAAAPQLGWVPASSHNALANSQWEFRGREFNILKDTIEFTLISPAINDATHGMRPLVSRMRILIIYTNNCDILPQYSLVGPTSQGYQTNTITEEPRSITPLRTQGPQKKAIANAISGNTRFKYKVLADQIFTTPSAPYPYVAGDRLNADQPQRSFIVKLPKRTYRTTGANADLVQTTAEQNDYRIWIWAVHEGALHGEDADGGFKLGVLRQLKCNDPN